MKAFFPNYLFDAHAPRHRHPHTHIKANANAHRSPDAHSNTSEIIWRNSVIWDGSAQAAVMSLNSTTADKTIPVIE